MTRLTDDELGELLRETFTEHEELVDRLPAATKRRSPLPAMLAAAAVLVVLAGVLYVANRTGAADSAPPAATPPTTRTADDDATIWTASIETLLRTVKPAAGAWRSVIVLDLSDVGTKHARKGPPISADQRETMTYLVRKIAPLQFHRDMAPAPPTCRDNRVGVVQLADVIDKGDHVEAQVSLFHDCNHWETATYRVEHRGPFWVVTATLVTDSQTW
ncbi:hypothetical protein OHA18_17190 [Kribbella sp. NBC_00709]|uniref:hypothetical protein n=1 Tax=Kribbella sp. NBC_00709 TaxID=2975972 RepID=UPI002E2E8984|nr:hypothetical protein [Kribbella sp. NBC_00709]